MCPGRRGMTDRATDESVVGVGAWSNSRMAFKTPQTPGNTDALKHTRIFVDILTFWASHFVKKDLANAFEIIS